MLPELIEIKKKRKHLRITQTELAARTGVSQSLIAKIESKSIVPSYENAKKLFDFFEAVQQEHRANARDFMTNKVIALSPTDKVRKAVRQMEKNSVSQMPVLENGKNVGTISEKSLIGKMKSEENSRELLEATVSEVMEDALPEIREETPFEIVSSILSHYPGALIVENGKVAGIITKSDILKAAMRPKQ